MADKARVQTEKILDNLEQQIGRIYHKDPALLSIEKEYARYMAKVKKLTEDSYKAYINESDINIKAEKKEAYMDELKRYTIESAEYKKLMNKIISTLAKVNQRALDIVNNTTVKVYCINYNQVAEDCKKAGIKVNG